MPCASVSEKPTRVSAEYLKGGLRAVGRPSSSSIRLHRKPRQRREPTVAVPIEAPVAVASGEPPHKQREQQYAECDEGEDRPRSRDAAAAHRRAAFALRRRTEVGDRAHARLRRMERCERGSREERVEQPLPMPALNFHVEEDRPNLGTPPWLEQKLQPGAVGRRPFEDPRVELPPGGGER